jgi:hypothetical protein
MKSILIRGASLIPRWALMGLSIASIVSIPAHAGTIGITFSNAGNLTGPPILNGTILTVDSLATGSILSFDPALNATWNPVTFHIHDFVDVTTGTSSGNGIFGLAFANGDALSGSFFQALSPAILATNMGPFTEILTITGGTGHFVGASGSISGTGLAVPTGFTSSGSGTLTAVGVSIPEPTSGLLIFGGLLALVVSRKARPRRAGPSRGATCNRSNGG